MPIDTAKTVLQVEGKEGYRSLMRRIGRGEISAFYQGAAATAIAAALGHFPWFYVHGLLDEALIKPSSWLGQLCRNAFIGFFSSVVSDTITNVVRVIKTTKQAAASLSSLSYSQTIQIIVAADGWKGLFGRGLQTRIVTNGTIRYLLLSLLKYLLNIIQNIYLHTHIRKYSHRSTIDPLHHCLEGLAGVFFLPPELGASLRRRR